MMALPRSHGRLPRGKSISAIAVLVMLLGAVHACQLKRSTIAQTTIDRDSIPRQYSEEHLRRITQAGAAAQAPAGTATISVTLDGTAFDVDLNRSDQMISLDLPEKRTYGESNATVPAPLYPSAAAAGVGSFVSASLLSVKAKQFDDGLVAAVELAADRGVGQFPSRQAMVTSLREALPDGADALEARALAAAALSLAGVDASESGATGSRAVAIEKEFLSDPGRSTPMGFYPWSEELCHIFRRDRLLQKQLDATSAMNFARIIGSNEDRLRDYQAIVHLSERLTNPLALPDLREAAAAVASGRRPAVLGSEALFPPSVAHETNIVKELYGTGPIPDGFDLANEMIRRIHADSLDLTPRPTSGWYDYQSWALEPLATPDSMPEASRLKFSVKYKKELEALFKGVLALSRETHIKQLDIPPVPGAPPPREVALELTPRLSIEPLAAFYLRRAISYAFIGGVLEDAFGTSGVAEIRRLTASGPINLPLSEELRLMRDLFYGAYLRSCREIGLTPASGDGLGAPSSAAATYASWLDLIQQDPDVGTDVRMMVPVFYDTQRQKMKVWAVLGVSKRPLAVWFSRSPKVVAVRAGGRTLAAGSVRVEYVGESHDLLYLVSAEVYVDKVLTRQEFRRLCDRFKTTEEILANLR